MRMVIIDSDTGNVAMELQCLPNVLFPKSNFGRSVPKKGNCMPKFVIKAFDRDYNEVPFAVDDGDFTVKIPDDCTLKRMAQQDLQATNKHGSSEGSTQICPACKGNGYTPNIFDSKIKVPCILCSKNI